MLAFLNGYKSRLLAKGLAQEYGADLEQNFAPIVRMTACVP